MTCRRRWGRWAIASVGFLSTAACGLGTLGGPFVDPQTSGITSDAEAGTNADGASDAGSTADGDDDAEVRIDGSTPIARDDAGCPIGRGPAMLNLFPSSPLCIDETEVSSRQYKPFIAEFEAGRTPPQIAECAGNTSVVPTDPSSGATPSLDSDDPVDRVDQCDARLFCEWAGKHLCRRRDDTDDYVTSAESTEADTSEWYAACSQNGASNSVPATANLQANSIAGRDADGQVLVSAAPPGGPTYAGKVLRHIVGNVAEWADGCDATGQCVTRGASVKTSSTTNCTTRSLYPRMEHRADVGFRCCAKPMP